MTLQLPGFQTYHLISVYGVIILIAAIIVKIRLFKGPNLGSFPTVGSSFLLGTWWSALRYVTNARSLIQEGYQKYKCIPFKISGPSHWTVVLSDRAQIEEMARVSNDQLSCFAAICDHIHFESILGPMVFHEYPNAGPVLSFLTRNMEVMYPAIRDEILTGFTDILGLEGNEWKSVPALSTVQRVICRTSNRLFVGLPLCRNPSWIELSIRCAVGSVKWGIVIALLPKFIQPLATRILTKAPENVACGVELLGPLVEQRQKHPNEYGSKREDKNNDLLSWLLDNIETSELTTENLASRMLVINFAAIYPPTNSFVRALFHLAMHPQYVKPLREEVEGIVGKDGWSKSALNKMKKIDSFLKECQRIEGINIVTLWRKALKDFTFSDGTFIPKGTILAAASHCLHHDEDIYDNPDAFEPFRFSEMCEEDCNDQKYQFASTSTNYLPFGHGRQACPGRFIASIELKSMLAHVVVTYDVKLEDGVEFPSSLHIGTLISANPHAKVMFRNRVDDRV